MRKTIELTIEEYKDLADQRYIHEGRITGQKSTAKTCRKLTENGRNC